MKKKILSFITLAILLACLSGCGLNNDTGGDVFYITISNHSGKQFEKIRYEYYLGETPIGGGDVEVYRGGAFDQPNEIILTFSPRDFPEKAELSEFRVELFVICDATVYPVGEQLSVSAAYGGNYPVTISGDTTGFTAELTIIKRESVLLQGRFPF